jgi:hypothetical protein
MSMYRLLCRVLTVLIVMIGLLAGSVPAQARTLRPGLPGVEQVAAFGERVRAFLASFWQAGMKEGTSLDPNGGRNDEGMSIDPDGVASGTTDEGMSIDPNGRH